MITLLRAVAGLALAIGLAPFSVPTVVRVLRVNPPFGANAANSLGDRFPKALWGLSLL